LLLWSFVLGCGRGDDERCDDVTAQIDQALELNIAKGVLVGTAVGCELTPESFDPRVQPDDLEYLTTAFQNACAIQAEECSGIPRRRLPPPSVPPPYSGPPSPPPPPDPAIASP
jgi:hypothetical protein